MDRVFITGLRVETVVGTHARERRVRQPLVLDLEMASETARAAATDDLAHAADHEAVGRRLYDAEQSGFEALEALPERLAETARSELGVPWLRLRLSEGAALRGTPEVGVEIERGERPA